MTVCIAALCDDGQGVVLASDQMVTVPFPINYEFEHEGSTKILPLVGETKVLLSGDVFRGHEMVGMARSALSKHRGPVTTAEATEVVRSCYQDLRRTCITQAQLEPRGLDIPSFYSNHHQLVPDLVGAIDQALANANLGIELVVAGRNGDRFAVYSVTHPGIVHDHSVLGYGVIGSGAAHAMYSLIEADYRPTMPRAQVVDLVTAAKTRSQVAPGVGLRTTLEAIPAEETHEQHSGDPRHEVDGGG